MFEKWPVPVAADSHRSIEIEAISYVSGRLRVKLREERESRMWEVNFESLQAFRVTSEECASKLLSQLDKDTGFFFSRSSDYLSALGAEKYAFMAGSCHFVISAYDEVVEVVADESSISFSSWKEE